MNRKTAILGTPSPTERTASRWPLARRGLWLCAALVCASAGLSACGQKGKLYLPPASQAASQPTPQTAP